MSVREHILSVLAGPERGTFLASLATHLATATRADYAEAGNDEVRALSALRALNELMIVITKQISSSLEGHPAYPDEAFLQVLHDKSVKGEVNQPLLWAMIEAGKYVREHPSPSACGR